MCNFVANSSFKTISLLIAPTKDFSSKNLWTIEVSKHYYASYFGYLAILNVLSRNTLSGAVFLVESLKSLLAVSCWKKVLSSSIWLMYLDSHVSLNFYILSLFLVNDSQAL